MRPNNKTVEKNVKQGDLLPCREIILGKAYKQRGRMNVNGEDFDYFMERIPGTEAPMEILTIDMTVIEVEGALFEVAPTMPLSKAAPLMGTVLAGRVGVYSIASEPSTLNTVKKVENYITTHGVPDAIDDYGEDYGPYVAAGTPWVPQLNNGSFRSLKSCR